MIGNELPIAGGKKGKRWITEEDITSDSLPENRILRDGIVNSCRTENSTEMFINAVFIFVQKHPTAVTIKKNQQSKWLSFILICFVQTDEKRFISSSISTAYQWAWTTIRPAAMMTFTRCTTWKRNTETKLSNEDKICPSYNIVKGKTNTSYFLLYFHVLTSHGGIPTVEMSLHLPTNSKIKYKCNYNQIEPQIVPICWVQITYQIKRIQILPSNTNSFLINQVRSH